MKLVSIIIPVYNAEEYLEKCIDSAIGQTYNNIEIIAINDGSTDKSLDILNMYAKKDNRIKIINIENSGISAVRNIGIKAATGEYICFLDSDDYIDNNLLENLHRYIDSDYDLIKYKTIEVDKEYNELNRIDGPIFEKKSGIEAFNVMFGEDIMLQVPWLYLYRKQFFIENKFSYPEGKLHEDFARTILIMLKAKKMCSTNIYGYYYVQTKKSITRGNEEERVYQRAMDMMGHYDYIVDKIEEYNLDEKNKENVKIYYTNCMILEIENLSKGQKKKYISEIKKRKMFKNIKARNIKQLIKKIILSVNINWYLKLR